MKRSTRLHLKQKLAALKNLAGLHSFEVQSYGRRPYATVTMHLGTAQHSVEVGLGDTLEQWMATIQPMLDRRARDASVRFPYNQPFPVETPFDEPT